MIIISVLSNSHVVSMEVVLEVGHLEGTKVIRAPILMLKTMLQ